jgi:uncharacterized protein
LRFGSEFPDPLALNQSRSIWSRTLTSELDKPLQGRKLPLRKKPPMPVGIIAAAGALGLSLVAVAIWVGADNWRGFASPAPVEVAVILPKDLVPTGTVAPAEDKIADPSRPNEMSRTNIDGGGAIIKVKPPSISDGEGSVILRDPAKLTQTAMLAHLPLPELIEKAGEKRLPKIGADGTRPFDAYARSWSGAAGPRIAIVITGLGLSQTGTQSAIRQLPEDVTLAFASEGNSIDRWMQAARREGHEIILQVPMEPFDYPNVSPGKFTLEASGSPEENRSRLEWALARTTNYTGIMNHMGAAFTASEPAVQALLNDLHGRGLMFLDDGTSARSVAQDVALQSGVPYALADFIIDGERTPGAILAKLNELEQTARSQGVAIGVGAAFNETVSAVSSWMNEARKRGIEFVPVSATAIDPERRG